jgi:DNA-binding NarL/FixJ family response regulator
MTADHPGDVIPAILALAADMIFGAKIRGTAQSLHLPLTLARNAKHLVELAAAQPARLIIVDLDTRGLDIGGTIAALKTTAPGVRVLAYVSHVNAEAIRRARSAGADQVLARSAFTQQLPMLLQQ